MDTDSPRWANEIKVGHVGRGASARQAVYVVEDPNGRVSVQLRRVKKVDGAWVDKGGPTIEPGNVDALARYLAEAGRIARGEGE